MPNLTIVAFGDSITQAVEVPAEQRWPALLQAALRVRFPGYIVVNAGVGGNTSREGLARIDAVLAHRPRVVLVEFGGNDATDEPDRHVSVEEYARNLEEMQRLIQDDAGAAMVLLTFPPIVNSWTVHDQKPAHQAHGGPDQHVELYRQSTRRFAGERGLPLIDIDQALRHACAKTDWATHYQPDGVHLTEHGNRVVFESVLAGVLGIGLD